MIKQVSGIILLFLGQFSFAQNKPKTILWEVSKNGITYKSYLFGTFHEVGPLFFDSLLNTNKKLAQTDVMYVEQKDAESNDTSGLYELYSWDIEKWSKLLNAVQIKIFDSFIKKSTDPTLYKSPPFVLNLKLLRIYAQNFCDTTYRASNELMDTHIESIGAKRKMQIYSLDENQINIFQKASGERDFAEIKELADNAVSLMDKMLNDDASACKVIEDYKNFNLDYQLNLSVKKSNRTMLTDRNNKWIAILDNVFKKHKCFVAVGFRHLFYKEGLIQQLRNKGYSVKPISSR